MEKQSHLGIPSNFFVEGSSTFLMSMTGQIEDVKFNPIDSEGSGHAYYAKTVFVCGSNDWILCGGNDESVTQLAVTTMSSSFDNKMKGYRTGVKNVAVWNHPLNVSFRSTSLFGWPRITMAVYRIDSFGNDVICGYGSTLVPISVGSHSVTVHLFIPKPSTLIQRVVESLGFSGWHRPELIDQRVVAKNEGRELIRTTSGGVATLKLNVVCKDLQKLGYDVSSRER